MSLEELSVPIHLFQATRRGLPLDGKFIQIGELILQTTGNGV
jgi:hypothetical protein